MHPRLGGEKLGGKGTCLSNARVTKPPPGLQGDFGKTGSLDSPGCSLSHCSLSGEEWRVTLNSWSSGHSLPSAKVTGMGRHTSVVRAFGDETEPTLLFLFRQFARGCFTSQIGTPPSLRLQFCF